MRASTSVTRPCEYPLLEALVNAVIEVAPRARVAFNTGRSDANSSHEAVSYVLLLSPSQNAVCVACQGVGSQPVPVALVSECSTPLV